MSEQVYRRVCKPTDPHRNPAMGASCSDDCYEPIQNKCAHGCGFRAGNDGYCDHCYADQCLIGPDGLCRYTNTEESDEG